ncbi:MAG: ABC transporter permease, partial [Candidatus Firestonebacteria bacterium]
MGIKEIFSHKLRSFLTTLGIILGTGSLISLFGIVDGGKETSMNWMKEVGGLEKVAIIWQEIPRQDRLKLNRSKGRTFADAVVLKQKADTLAIVSPEIAMNSSWFEYKRKRYRSSLYGVTHEFLDINRYEVVKGRYINDLDIERSARVVVIGQKIAYELFRNEEPLGKQIYINGQYFTVVGVLKKYEMWIGKRNAIEFKNNWASIPLTTMANRFMGNDTLTYLNIQVKDTDRIDEAIQQTRNILLKRHFYIEDFKYDTKEDQMARIKQSTDMWTMILGAIGLISLLVGGLGIMNIMLASVTERTREIGIRRAIGAKRKDVLSQFMAEAFMISIMGGLLGILFGVIMINLFSTFPD